MKGLYDKYIITKADGTPVKGFHFVLSPETDETAWAALSRYIELTPNRQLAADLRRELRDIVDRENDVDEALAADMRQGGRE